MNMDRVHIWPFEQLWMDTLVGSEQAQVLRADASANFSEGERSSKSSHGEGEGLLTLGADFQSSCLPQSLRLIV
jgi:hypothetical protein